MGALPVANYSKYKELKKARYASQRIPVGMDSALWQAKLRQAHVDAAFSHAAWAARAIAKWVETRRRAGVGVEDSLELLASDRAAFDRLACYQVHAVLRPMAIELARKIVQSAQRRAN